MNWFWMKTMDNEQKDSLICQYMKELLNNYNKIRGRTVDSSELFWDAVIISASDTSQKKGYEAQIAGKQCRGEIPLDIPFHVFADPPGYKIGCGGSTMFVLEKIFQIYGNAMHDMHFLLIPAGGYSQRLPNLCVIGKLFCPLPFGDMRYQMLDLILATYLPFLKNMPPGVFLASSDAIISYSLSDKDIWTFKNEGFTALAHPSPVHIGTSHGVYILPENQDLGNNSAVMSECLRVLQKPSVHEMYDKGAVLKTSCLAGGDEVQDVIFSDSAFFFDNSVISKLLNFYKTNKPLKCELSSYGDFLQPLGLSASPSYIVEKITSEDLASTRSALYRTLYGLKLSILVLKNSNFHHLGTMKEYIDSLSCKNKFSEMFPVSRFSVSTVSINNIIPLYIEGTVMYSIIHPLSIVHESAIIEYCDINIAVDVGKNCIISNVQLHGVFVQRLSFLIPENTLMHTVSVMDGYVCIACAISDDIKKTFKQKDSLEIQIFGKKLKQFIRPDDSIFSSECSKPALWNAKLFPLCKTADEAFKKTLEIIVKIIEEERFHLCFTADNKVLKWVSMSDVLSLKDTEKVLGYQKELYEKIMFKTKSVNQFM